MKLLILCNWRLGKFYLGLCLKLKTCEDRLTNQWFFPRIRIFILRNCQNRLLFLIYLGTQSHLWPQLQVSFLPTRWQSQDLRFWGRLVVITMLSVHCDWLLIVQRNQEVFCEMESSRFSNPGFPIFTTLMFSFKVSIQWFLFELENLTTKSLNLYPSVESLMDQISQKELLVFTHLGKQTYASSTQPISFFPSRCLSR